MNRYKSHKIVEAIEIVKFEHNEHECHVFMKDEIGLPLRLDASFCARGVPKEGDYLVKYDNYYYSWSPKDVFEDGYSTYYGDESPVSNSSSNEIADETLNSLMSFGQAIEAMKRGGKLQRAGWNGKDMWISYTPGEKNLPAENLWNPANREYAIKNGGSVEVLPAITMKTATGEILMGWLASQTDMLANDWQVID